MATARYEYSYTDNTDPANPVPMMFGLHGVGDDVAKAIRAALRKTATVSNVSVDRITEDRQAVTGPDPA